MKRPALEHWRARRQMASPLQPLPDCFSTRHPFWALLLRGLAVDLIIEILCRHSIIKALGFVVTAPHLFLFNALIISLTYSLVLVARRRAVVETLVSTFWLGLGIADFVVTLFRTTPLSYTDFVMIPYVKGIVTYYVSPFLLVVVILLLLAGLVFMISRLLRTKRYVMNLRHALLLPVYGAIVLASTVLLLTTGLLPDHYENLISAYQENGFVYCFMRGLIDQGIEEPQDYGEDSIDDIMTAIRQESSAASSLRPNIVMVQLESFFDPAHLTGIELDEETLPEFSWLRDNYPSGYLTVPVFGAGTVNTEFEILTGMSVRDFGTGEFPYHTVLQEDPCESICYNLAELGYTSHAIHNNIALFYNRYGVFANLGFDTFTSIEYMNGVEYNPIGWAKDKILTRYIMKALLSTDSSDFVYAISVQPHGSYPDDVPSDPIAINSDGFPDEESKKSFAYYVSQLQETDAFVGQLIDTLSRLDQPTIVVFYGDHLPNFSITDDMLDQGSIYQTEYVIWSNYELNAQDRDLNAWQLSAYLLELAGFDNGILTKLHQNYSHNSNYAEALQMLEYDMLYGERSVYSGENPYQPTQLQMGLSEITINSLRCGEKTMSVYGSNFTTSSAVYVNGDRQHTEFVSSGELIALVSAEQGDQVFVAQLSNGGIVSQTETFSVTAP